VAASGAYEQPTLNRAWEAFIVHIPTVAVVWIASTVIGVFGTLIYFLIVMLISAIAGGQDASSLFGQILGLVGSLPFQVIGSLVNILLIAIPAIYYESGKVVTISAAFLELIRRPLRYLLAGILFSFAVTLGILFCVIPGIILMFITPVYVNRIFNTDMSILDAFSSSVQAVFGSQHGISFVLINILAALVAVIIGFCTCGLGLLVITPVLTFYIQNAAYAKGIIS